MTKRLNYPLFKLTQKFPTQIQAGNLKSDDEIDMAIRLNQELQRLFYTTDRMHDYAAQVCSTSVQRSYYLLGGGETRVAFLKR